MTISVTQTLTTTGAQAAIDVGVNKVLSYAMESNNADAAVDVEVQLTENGSWKKVTVGIAEATVVNLSSPVIGIRANITSLTTSTTVTFEVIDSSR